MKRYLTYLFIVAVTAAVTIACYGSYQNHDYSISTVNPEPITEYIYVPVYIEQPVNETAEAEPVEEETFCLNLSEEDCELLEQIAMAEAGNQDTVGKALVMLTVLNRVEKTGLSIREVIYAPNQYYTAGMCPGDEDCHEALAMILGGWDESQGATCFRTGHYHNFGIPLFQHQDHFFSKT